MRFTRGFYTSNILLDQFILIFCDLKLYLVWRISDPVQLPIPIQLPSESEKWKKKMHKNCNDFFNSVK